jgi:hypothetical protein
MTVGGALGHEAQGAGRQPGDEPVCRRAECLGTQGVERMSRPDDIPRPGRRIEVFEGRLIACRRHERRAQLACGLRDREGRRIKQVVCHAGIVERREVDARQQSRGKPPRSARDVEQPERLRVTPIPVRAPQGRAPVRNARQQLVVELGKGIKGLHLVPARLTPAGEATRRSIRYQGSDHPFLHRDDLSSDGSASGNVVLYSVSDTARSPDVRNARFDRLVFNCGLLADLAHPLMPLGSRSDGEAPRGVAHPGRVPFLAWARTSTSQDSAVRLVKVPAAGLPQCRPGRPDPLLDLLPIRPYFLLVAPFSGIISAPGRIRTCDLRIRSPLLYPTELRARADPSRSTRTGTGVSVRLARLPG